MAGLHNCWNCKHRYQTLKTNWNKPCPNCGKRPNDVTKAKKMRRKR